MLKSRITMVSLVLVESTSWRTSVMKELNEESGGRCTKIYLIDLEPTLHREKITKYALCVIVCLVEITRRWRQDIDDMCMVIII